MSTQSALSERREQLLSKAILFKRNAASLHEFKKVLSTLNLRGIFPVVLKGAYLSEMLYRDIGVRHFNDIDILIKKNDLETVTDIMFDSGYAYTVPHRAVYSEDFGSQIAFSKGEITLDVHWDIVDVDRFNKVTGIKIEDFWKRSRKIALFNGVISELEVTDLLLYLLLHLSLQHCFQGNVLFDDIREVLRRWGAQIKWDQLAERALLYRVSRPVYFSLYYAKRYHRADLPHHVLEALQPRRIGIFDKAVFKVLDEGGYFDGMDCIVMPFMLDNWKDRFLFLLGNPKGSPRYISHSLYLIVRAIKNLPLLLKNSLL